MSHYLKTIVGKFTMEGRACLDDAISLAAKETHFEVEATHLLQAWMARQPRTAERLCLIAGLRGDVLLTSLCDAVQRCRQGNTDKPVLSVSLVALLEQAWLKASAEWSQTLLPAGALFASALAHRDDPLFGFSLLLREAMVCNSEQAESVLRDCDPVSAGAGAGAGAPVASENSDLLNRYTHNLTEEARKGTIDPIIGREEEIRQTIDVLLRRRQNNPVLTGEPGVGKTALVEGLAQRIVAGTVPDALREMEVLTLDLAQLQAGASVKGEFEKRLEGLLKAVRMHPRGVILFIDEAHTLVGAGGASGQNDAANLLKPALARGEVRVIAATTRAEYKKYIEQDAALARRFQEIKVDAPDEERATAMLRAISGAMAAHHHVDITDSALVAAVRLSERFIPERQLPDKAVSLIDTACARVALSRCYQPHQIEDLDAHLARVNAQYDGMKKENATRDRLAPVEAQSLTLADELAELHPRWQQQQQLVTQLAQTQCPDEQKKLRAQLRECQQEHPMVFERVDETCVADVVAGWTGIPVGRLNEKEHQQTEKLADSLFARVIGQNHALAAIATQIRIARAGLNDPDKPTGVFMLAGPSGVGKTETALAIADLAFGGSQNLTVINMSEYQEAHSVAGLKGSPPGYVGYGEGGILTEAVRRRPYCVVLLDEVEKAHPDVMELFYQVFDKGEMEDAEGQRINFRNTLILMTSNLASEQISQADGEGNRDSLALEERIRPAFERHFKPALMGRMTLIPYLCLDDDALGSIVRLKLDAIVARVNKVTSGAATLQYRPPVVEYIVQNCQLAQSGARVIDSIINTQILPLLADQISATKKGPLQLGITKNRLAITRSRKVSA